MTNQRERQTSCVLRIFGAEEQQLQDLTTQLSFGGKLTAQYRCRGAETLLALQSEQPGILQKAANKVRKALGAAVYAEGETVLAEALVQTLEQHRCLLTSADAAAGALLESRLEAVPGADKVFDFGSMSYADERTAAQIDQLAHRRAKRPGELELARSRVRAARQLVDTDLAVTCVGREDHITLLVGSKKGCWLRTVRTEDGPGLWLMDIVRRAACGLPQAAGTLWQRWKDPVPENVMLPAEMCKQTKLPQRGPHKGVCLGRGVLVLLLTAVLLAAGWYCTGGNIEMLPQLWKQQDTSFSDARMI